LEKELGKKEVRKRNKRGKSILNYEARIPVSVGATSNGLFNKIVLPWT